MNHKPRKSKINISQIEPPDSWGMAKYWATDGYHSALFMSMHTRSKILKAIALEVLTEEYERHKGGVS